MKFIRPFLAVAFIVVLAALGWVWWNRPQRVDMADYAPADGLVYLECNNLLDIAESISSTDAWKDLSPLLGTAAASWPNPWLRRLVAWTGIGPTQAVILARAQVAVVMIDLGTEEQGQSLTFRPEAAVLIETHTGERRIRPTVEEAIRQFAEQAYKQPTLRRSEHAGAQFIVWSAPSSDRHIVATTEGTLVIVGNSERVVKECLDVHRRQRPSLRNDPEMQRLRHHLAERPVLAFGFVSSANAARLLSIAVPVLFGRGPGELRFERTFSSSASKVSAGVAWSSQSSGGGIEDRYLFSLQPALVTRLKPAFKTTDTPVPASELLPDDVYSVTFYQFENPAAAWTGFETAVSAQLDALSAMLLTSIVKSALTPYGIRDPEKFLSLVGPELATVRLTQGSERSVLVAKVRDEVALQELMLGPRSQGLKRTLVGDVEVFQNPEEAIAVSFVDGKILIGPLEDVRTCIQAAQGKQANPLRDGNDKPERFPRLSNSPGVVTYTKDGERVLGFVRTIARANGSLGLVRDSTDLKRRIEELPYSTTETTLGDNGVERRTRSSFGQFSTLVPLLFPDQ